MKRLDRYPLEMKKFSLRRREHGLKNSVIIFLFLFLFDFAIGQPVEIADQTELKSGSGQRSAVSMCPGGIAFGIFSMNYEHMFTKNHALMARVDYEAIPTTYSDASIESSGKAFILNYRYHIGGNLESFYLGAYTRYRVYQGDGALQSTEFEFTIPEVTVGINVGKRWIWDSGFTMNFALGYGYSKTGRNVQHSNPAVEASIDTFEKEYDFIDAFLGEFSIGYAF